MGQLWRKFSLLGLSALALFSIPATADPTPPSIWDEFLNPRALPAEESDALWGGEPTFTSVEIIKDLEARRAAGEGDNKAAESPFLAKEVDRLLAGILKRCPQCKREESADYDAKLGLRAKVIRVDGDWTLALSPDPGVVETHITPRTLGKWQAGVQQFQEVLFDPALAEGFFGGTMSGNGHLTRDLKTGFGGDVLWALNAIVDHWNHPELADRIFDSWTENAVTMSRKSPEQRERILEWLKRFSQDYLFYLDTLGQLLSAPEPNFAEIRDVLRIKPTVASMLQSYREFVRGQNELHDEPVNLEHSNRIEFRGFFNQTSAFQWVNQVKFLEHRIQRMRPVDGFISFDPSALTAALGNKGAVHRFLDFGEGLEPSFLRELLPDELRSKFDAAAKRQRSELKLGSPGIRSREVRLWKILAEKLSKALDAEAKAVQSAHGARLNKEQALRIYSLFSCVGGFLEKLPDKLATSLLQDWQKQLEKLIKIADETPHEITIPLSRRGVFFEAWWTSTREEERAKTYWESINNDDSWSKRAVKLIEGEKGGRVFDSSGLITKWMIRYRREASAAVTIDGFQNWLSVRSIEQDFGDLYALRVIKNLAEFLTTFGAKEMSVPLKLLESYLNKVEADGAKLGPYDAQIILTLPFAPIDLKRKLWPIYRNQKKGAFELSDFLQARQVFGLDFHFFSALEKARLLASQSAKDNPDELRVDIKAASREVFYEIESLIAKEKLKTEPDTKFISELAEVESDLPVFGREMYAKFMEAETRPSEKGALRMERAYRFLELLKLEDLTPGERLSIFGHYFSLEPDSHQTEEANFRFYRDLWGLLKNGEFREQKSAWKKRLRQLGSGAMKERYSREPAVFLAAKIQPPIYRRTELVEGITDIMNDLLVDYRRGASRDWIKEQLVEQLDRLRVLNETRFVKKFSTKSWGVIARSMVITGKSLDFNNRVVPGAFWRAFIEEMRDQVKYSHIYRDVPEKLENAAKAVSTQRSAPELWNFLREELTGVLKSRETGAEAGRRFYAVSDGLSHFVRLGREVPKDVQTLLEKVQKVRRAKEKEKNRAERPSSLRAFVNVCQSVLSRLAEFPSLKWLPR